MAEKVAAELVDGRKLLFVSSPAEIRTIEFPPAWMGFDLRRRPRQTNQIQREFEESDRL